MRYFMLCTVILFLGKAEAFCHYGKPPGTVLLDKKTQTYIDVSEITIVSWLEYLYWLKKEKGELSEEYISALPDSATCEKLYGAVRYFQHPKYRNYPMVGVTYQQVIAYCQWRSDRVNEAQNKYKVVYSLPDEYDYQLALKKQKIKGKASNVVATIHPINPKKRKLSGIGYNANELTANPTVIIIGMEGDQLMFDDYRGVHYLLGFRCKAVIKK
jgi:hypothetical protein